MFAPDSVWNAPLGPNTPLDPSSERRTRALGAEIRREIKEGTGPWISDLEYSTPVYVVSRYQPRVRVELETGEWGDPLRDALEEGVPIPPGARPSKGTDGHLTIHQPSTGMLWEFWRARREGGRWRASWGGVMPNTAQNPGFYHGENWNWGSTASSLPVAAGTILIEELRRGRIDHALAVSLPEPCQGVFAWPAQRTDGGSAEGDCIPEGARLRIDPGIDLERIPMAPVERTIARAAQRYGMIVRDRTGHAVGLSAETPQRPDDDDLYRSPWPLYGGLAPWEFLRERFPWQHLQLVDMQLCRRSPCVRD